MKFIEYEKVTMPFAIVSVSLRLVITENSVDRMRRHFRQTSTMVKYILNE
jgi:hypothetical protein